MREHMSGRWVGKLAMIAVMILIFVVGFGNAVEYLWNWLMPPLFGLRTVTYWQALGLLGLSWLLFGGWRGAGMHARRHHMRERWDRMTPEEREKFREKFREGVRAQCGFGPEKADA